MRNSSLFIAAISLLLPATRACGSPLPSDGLFYITVVPKDGSDSWPASVATVSRGVVILSSTKDYLDQFSLNRTSGKTLLQPENSSYGSSGSLAYNTPIILGQDPSAGDSPSPDSWNFTLDEECDSYLIKDDSNSTSDIFQFSGVKRDDNLGAAISWNGNQGTVGLKITTEKP